MVGDGSHSDPGFTPEKVSIVVLEAEFRWTDGRTAPAPEMVCCETKRACTLVNRLLRKL
jgi:hypothetical protein